MGAELREQRWTTSIVADGEEEDQVTVDAEESCFVNSCKVSWWVKRSEVEGVRDGGTRSIPALWRNLRMCGPWSRVHEWLGCLVRRTPQTPVEVSLKSIGP